MRWAWLVALWLGACAQADTIRFAPLPLVDEKTLRTQYLPMLDYLAAKTGDDYRWVYYEQYHDLLAALVDDKVDLAVLGPLPYAEISGRKGGFEALVEFLESDGKADYHCALVSFGPAGKLTLRDIRDKRIGLTQPESTCGYFAVALMLKRVGLAPDRDGNRFEYADDHTKAALGVLQGRYDVAGVKRNLADRYAHLGLTVIAEAGPFPAFVLVANSRRLSVAKRRAIRAAMLAADPAARAEWGGLIQRGTVPVQEELYEEVRRNLETVAPIPGMLSIR
ncbi:hypothetical protein EZJ19_13280 [Parasulfuritortus cantonensis]|uniref:Phosphate/phosphite/phosphonate ABC transporter substrate-binding protein n=1 Tax=Parasulfuritortus cantonensis TaxID=2528202 RepID=A0A4R1B1P1_9PROT|nr:PhnD/SsuA/transferrin family substrate-binding protein [Parasulfuritortus cantonensis]TCJ11934.1 hypothetical protein EZJ19_13280 [Parasulfuritortus cantonensis]